MNAQQTVLPHTEYLINTKISPKKINQSNHENNGKL